MRCADRMLKLCCKNGGVFIKVGQHVGSMDYLLPKEYVNTMKVLHDQAPESTIDDILTVVRQDLGQQVRLVSCCYLLFLRRFLLDCVAALAYDMLPVCEVSHVNRIIAVATAFKYLDLVYILCRCYRFIHYTLQKLQ